MGRHWQGVTEDNYEWPGHCSMSLGRVLNPAQVEYESDVLFHSVEISVPL